MIARIHRDIHCARFTAHTQGRLVLPHIPDSLQRSAVCIGIMATAATAGVMSTLMDARYALRAAVGLPVILTLVRYRYALLLAWALITVFFGSTVTTFSDKNIDTTLTVPLVLVMAALPVTQTFQRMPALAFLLLYLIWMLTGLPNSAYDTSTALKLWTLRLDVLALAVLAVNVVVTRRRMLGLIDAILGLSAALALYGLIAYVTRQSGFYDPESGGVYRLCSIFCPDASAPVRFYSTSGAFFFSMMVPLALYRLFTVRGLGRAAMAVLVLILLVTIGLTFTRTAFIALPMGIAAFILALPSRSQKIGIVVASIIAAGLALAVGAVGHVPLFERFSANDLATLNGRTYLWHFLLGHFDPTLVLGKGFGASDLLLERGQIGGNGVTGGPGLVATSPHSLFLGTLYDHGIMGVVLLVLIAAVLLANLVAGVCRAPADRRMLYATALAVFVIAVVQCIDSSDFWAQSISPYFWIIVALPFAAEMATSPAGALPDGHLTLTRGSAALGAPTAELDAQ